MRERMAYGALETGALTSGTAVTVMLAPPSRTPVTSPVCDTRTNVLSEEIQTNVRPVRIGTRPASAVAVSCCVPLGATVISAASCDDCHTQQQTQTPHAPFGNTHLIHSIRAPRRGPTIDTLVPASWSVPKASCACSTAAARSLSR